MHKKYLYHTILFFCLMVGLSGVLQSEEGVVLPEKSIKPAASLPLKEIGYRQFGQGLSQDKADQPYSQWVSMVMGASDQEGFEVFDCSPEGSFFALFSPQGQEIKVFDIDSFQEKASIDFYRESDFTPLKVQFIRSDIIGIVSAAENQAPAASQQNGAQALRQIGQVKTFTYSLDLFSVSTGKLRHRFLITRNGKVYYLRLGGERGVHEIPHFSVSPDEKWLAIGYADWVRIYDWEKYFSTGMLAMKEEAQILTDSLDEESITSVLFSNDSKFLLVRRSWFEVCYSLYDYGIRCSPLKTVINILGKMFGVSAFPELIDKLGDFTGADAILAMEDMLEAALRGSLKVDKWKLHPIAEFDGSDPRIQPVIPSGDPCVIGSNRDSLLIQNFKPFLLEFMAHSNWFQTYCLYLAGEDKELLDWMLTFFQSLFSRGFTIKALRLDDYPEFISVSPNGKWVAAGGKENLVIMDRDGWEIILTIELTTPINHLHILPGNKRVIFLRQNIAEGFQLDWGGVVIWDLSPHLPEAFFE